MSIGDFRLQQVRPICCRMHLDTHIDERAGNLERERERKDETRKTDKQGATWQAPGGCERRAGRGRTGRRRRLPFPVLVLEVGDGWRWSVIVKRVAMLVMRVHLLPVALHERGSKPASNVVENCRFSTPIEVHTCSTTHNARHSTNAANVI